MRRSTTMLLVTVAVLVLPVLPALGHAEREATFPSGEAGVPTYRHDGPRLVVCKDDTPRRLAHLPPELRRRNAALLEECAFEHVQAAVDAVTEQGTRILVMPGVYREEPSIAARENPSEACAPLADREGDGGEGGGEEQGGVGGELGGEPDSVGAPVYSYEEQSSCPHVQNLIAVFGDSDDDGVCDNALCDLQVEGTGATPTDVVIDGDYGHLNGIRADRADGFHLSNLTVQRFEFNAVYVLETDGFVFDEVITRWNDEYGFLSFAVDHGLYEDCEGYGNGDSAIYPGSASDINSDRTYIEDIRDEIRFATEIRGCRGHHNTLGYSGTAGNSVWTHHNEFDHNATGFATDSLFPDHPGLPQDHALVEHNLIHSNNFNPYVDYVQEGVCTGPFGERGYDDGVVCPVIPVRVGSGIMIAGGNHNLVEDNTFFDNWVEGVWQFFVPATFRGEDDPDKQFDTSNHNTHRGNRFGVNPNGDLAQPSALADLHWDGEGEGNCWEDNVGVDGAATSAIAENPAPLPGCDPRPGFTPGPGVAVHAQCAEYDRESNPDPEGCEWFDEATPPSGREHGPDGGPVLQRVAGGDRVATAVAASRELHDRAETVVVARSDLYVDALVAGALASKVDGSLLVNTPGPVLDDAVRDEIARLGARRAIVIGGETALPAGIEDALRGAGVTDVTRIGGADRYATARSIADLVGGAHLFVTRGDDPTDTTAVAYLSAKLGRPIMPVPPSGLDDDNVAMLESGVFTDAKVVGGEAAVPAAVEEQLAGYLPDLERLAGDTRYATSLAVAEYAVATGSDPTELWFTTGTNWVDGIGASPVVAADEGVLLLTSGDPDEDTTTEWLDEHGAVVERIRVLGGEVAVPEAFLDGLRDDHGAVDGDAVGDRTGGEEVTVGAFAPYADAPEAYADATGWARMTRSRLGTTRVEVWVEGLPADTRHPLHVHVASCDEDRGGPHFKFDPDGGDMPPNEIHPTFTTDEVGVGHADVTAFEVADDTARSINVHTPEGDKVVCVDLA